MRDCTTCVTVCQRADTCAAAWLEAALIGENAAAPRPAIRVIDAEARWAMRSTAAPARPECTWAARAIDVSDACAC